MGRIAGSILTVQEVSLAVRVEDSCNVGVGSAVVTVGLVGAITVVGPKTMDRPGITRSSSWVGIPKLRLKQGSTRGVEATVSYVSPVDR